MDASTYQPHLRAQDHHWWFKARRRAVDRLLARSPRSGDLRILDLGSGTGANLPVLARHGQVTAVDRSPDAIEALRNNPHAAHVVQADATALTDHLSPGYDLVAMLDVLEHIPQDVAALAQARQLLAAGGRILLTVPAHPWLFGPHDELLHHQRRYTRTHLTQVLHQAGLRPLKMRWLFATTFPLLLADRAVSLLTRRPADPNAIEHQAASPLNRLLYALVHRETDRPGSSWVGSSLLVSAAPA